LFQGLFEDGSAPEKSGPNGEHNFGHHWCHHQCEKSGEDTACGGNLFGKNLTVTLNLFQGLFKKDSAPEKSGPNGEHNFGHHWCPHQ
tara:strand:- start:3877 stop:4137 length:261 start_codon:yes stop_codon:yes gene_type:complete